MRATVRMFSGICLIALTSLILPHVGWAQDGIAQSAGNAGSQIYKVKTHTGNVIEVNNLKKRVFFRGADGTHYSFTFMEVIRSLDLSPAEESALYADMTRVLGSSDINSEWTNSDTPYPPKGAT